MPKFSFFQKVYYVYMFSFTDVSQVSESQHSGITVDLVDGLKTSMCQPTFYCCVQKVSTKVYGLAGGLICSPGIHFYFYKSNFCTYLHFKQTSGVLGKY